MRSIVQPVFRRAALFILLEDAVKGGDTGETRLCSHICNGDVGVTQ